MATFRLDRLLRLRGQLRSLRQLELQQAEGARVRLVDERLALQAERQRVLEETLRATQRGELDGAGLHLARAYEHALDQRTQRVEQHTVVATQHVAKRRNAVAAERREERKLEHLAERYRERLEIEQALAAERMLDELTMSRHARENGEDDRG
jgi:flagellar export protein FliJ